MGIAVAIGTSWVFAGSCICNRIIKEIHFSVVLFYHTIIGTTIPFLVVGLYSWITHSPFLKYNSTQWGLMLLGGFFDFVAISANIVAF